MEKEIKEGDLILVQDKFDIKNTSTWLIPLIHVGQNVETFWGIKGKWFSYHHVAIVVKKPYSGELCYFEAAKRCRFVPLYGIKKYKKVMVLKPTFLKPLNNLYKCCIVFNERVYDYRGVLLDQVLRYFSELLFNIFTLGKGKGSCLKVHRDKISASKRAYCSELVLQVYNMAMGLGLFDSQHQSPKDIYEMIDLNLFKIKTEATSPKEIKQLVEQSYNSSA